MVQHISTLFYLLYTFIERSGNGDGTFYLFSGVAWVA